VTIWRRRRVAGGSLAGHGLHEIQQVILAVDALSPGVTEGYLVVDQYLEAAAELPGLVGYAYDPGATRDSP
jgi:hypothetical protein